MILPIKRMEQPAELALIVLQYWLPVGLIKSSKQKSDLYRILSILSFVILKYPSLMPLEMSSRRQNRLWKADVQISICRIGNDITASVLWEPRRQLAWPRIFRQHHES